MSKDINRLKVVLAEKKRTNKWLAEQLDKDPATVSKWCTNTIQPNVETLVEIAKYLNVEIQDLFWPIKSNLNNAVNIQRQMAFIYLNTHKTIRLCKLYMT